MEDETRDFLVLVANTISKVLLWMMLNVFVGIYKGFAFFEKAPSWKNILYYIALVATLTWLVLHIKTKWKQWEAKQKVMNDD